MTINTGAEAAHAWFASTSNPNMHSSAENTIHAPERAGVFLRRSVEIHVTN
jgi:hypothetical protein